MTKNKLPCIYVEYKFGSQIRLRPEGLNTIGDIKAKIHELEGILPDQQSLIFDGKELHGNQTLLEKGIGMGSTLHLVTRTPGTISNGEGPQSAPTQPKVKPKRRYKLRKHSAPQVVPPQTKRPRHSIVDTNDGEVRADFIQGIATSADPQPMSNSTYEEKLNLLALHQDKVTAVLRDLMPEIRARPPPSVLTELEDLKREMAQMNEVFSGQRASYENQIVALEAQKKKAEEFVIAGNKEKELFSGQRASYESRIVALEAQNKKFEDELVIAGNKEKEFEATISGLTLKNRMFSVSYESQIASLKAENKETVEELTLARIKENELEATISELTHKNRTFSAQILALEDDGKKTKQLLMASHNKEKEQEATISILRAQKEKTEEEVTVGRNREKEQEATISGLTHKNKIFSAQCTTYENQVTTLEVENKKIKEELLNADKKYYAGARSAGYAEGLKEGKAKWLKSVDFLHHLTDASMKYFNYGFDSCQKQAEEQGFVGQLNKDSALKEAPQLDSGRNT